MAKTRCHLQIVFKGWKGDDPVIEIAKMQKRAPSGDGFWLALDVNIPDHVFLAEIVRARLEAAVRTDGIILIQKTGGDDETGTGDDGSGVSGSRRDSGSSHGAA